VGPQYRSIIMYTNEQQKEIAQQVSGLRFISNSVALLWSPQCSLLNTLLCPAYRVLSCCSTVCCALPQHKFGSSTVS
jgi:hypothetical protein